MWASYILKLLKNCVDIYIFLLRIATIAMPTVCHWVTHSLCLPVRFCHRITNGFKVQFTKPKVSKLAWNSLGCKVGLTKPTQGSEVGTMFRILWGDKVGLTHLSYYRLNIQLENDSQLYDFKSTMMKRLKKILNINLMRFLKHSQTHVYSQLEAFQPCKYLRPALRSNLHIYRWSRWSSIHLKCTIQWFTWGQ